MIYARSVVKFFCLCMLGSITALSASAQQQNISPKPTQRQVADFVRNNPTLSSGFETQIQKATVRLVKQVPGGLMLRYATGNVTGTLTVVGPTAVAFEKSLITDIIDGIVDEVKKILNRGSGGGCAKSTTTITLQDGTKISVQTAAGDCQS